MRALKTKVFSFCRGWRTQPSSVLSLLGRINLNVGHLRGQGHNLSRHSVVNPFLEDELKIATLKDVTVCRRVYPVSDLMAIQTFENKLDSCVIKGSNRRREISSPYYGPSTA